MSELHIERVGDELIITVPDPDGATVVSLPIPDGLAEFIEALKAEGGLE